MRPGVSVWTAQPAPQSVRPSPGSPAARKAPGFHLAPVQVESIVGNYVLLRGYFYFGRKNSYDC